MNLNFFKNFSLSSKLNLLLASIFIIVVAIGSIILSIILEKNAREVVTDKALVLIETMSSVRNYTTNQVNPELASRLEKEDTFLPQTVPGYSAREVFDNLRNKKEYADFFYKEATLNPTNLRDKADEFETKIVEEFRKNTNINQKTGFRSIGNSNIFYIARPLAVTKESCLRCHSTPDVAPKSLITTYGEENGFNWKMNEIVGAQIVSVPASKVLDSARSLQWSIIGVLLTFLLLAILVINWFLKKSVTQPLAEMSSLAKKVSTGDLNGEFKHGANDEIGILASSLSRMKISLEMALDMLNSEPKN
jgi:HAMP domain-containing protein